MVNSSRHPNGVLIRLLREVTGVSREALAEQMGISYTHLSNIEAGRRAPSLSHIHTIEAALGLEPGRLAAFANSDLPGATHIEEGVPTAEARDAYVRALQDLELRGWVVNPALADAHLDTEIREWNRRASAPPRPRRRPPTGEDMALAAALGGPDPERRSAVTYLSQLVQQLPDRDVELLIAFAKGLARDSSRMPR